MLQAEKADDYVLATGETHTIKELCEESFNYVGLNWEDFVMVDKRFVRLTEIKPVIENPEKAKKILKWEPKTKFKELVKMMVDANVARLKQFLNFKNKFQIGNLLWIERRNLGEIEICAYAFFDS